MIDKLIICIDCNKGKPRSEYYIQPSGNPYSRCKKCHVKEMRKYRSKDQEPPEHEKRVLLWLHSHGIVATHGKYLSAKQFNYTDLVAFGCIKIECKWVNPVNRIHFSKKQRNTRYHADVVILEKDESAYAVYPITYQGFYKNGKLRPTAQFEDLEFSKYRNRYDLIEYLLKRKRVALIKKTMGTNVVQLPLFKDAS